MAEPILGMRFSVLFMAGGAVANPIDLRFRRVSGLSVEVETEAQPSGGCNTYQQPLPKAVRHGNLVLERGMVIGSPLLAEFNASLGSFKFLTSNVLVTLLSADSLPLAAWLFMKAWPVKWSTSDLDASEPGLVIDTLELAYTRMQPMRL